MLQDNGYRLFTEKPRVQFMGSCDILGSELAVGLSFPPFLRFSFPTHQFIFTSHTIIITSDRREEASLYYINLL
jgi:hypothetical protein